MTCKSKLEDSSLATESSRAVAFGPPRRVLHCCLFRQSTDTNQEEGWRIPETDPSSMVNLFFFVFYASKFQGNGLDLSSKRLGKTTSQRSLLMMIPGTAE